MLLYNNISKNYNTSGIKSKIYNFGAFKTFIYDFFFLVKILNIKKHYPLDKRVYPFLTQFFLKRIVK